MLKKRIIILVTGIIGITAIFLIWQWPRLFLSQVDAEQMSADEKSELQSNINSFMESQADERDRGWENYHCDNILFGYDEEYAYALVYCSGFINYENGAPTWGTAFIIPTRLGYTQPHFRIIDYKQPLDGSGYVRSLRELFPGKFYDKALSQPSNAAIKELRNSLEAKARN